MKLGFNPPLLEAANVSTHTKRRHNRQQLNKKRDTKHQRFSKIKRATSLRSKPTQCSTFAFAPTARANTELT